MKGVVFTRVAIMAHKNVMISFEKKNHFVNRQRFCRRFCYNVNKSC